MESLMNFKLHKSKDNLVATVFNLLRLLNVKVTSTLIKDTLLSNPNYPSLLSISESLKLWKIDSEAYTVPTDKLKSLPTPFIAHLKENSGLFVTVKEIGLDYVTYIRDDGQDIKMALNEFLNKWTHNVLLTESLPGGGQADYAKERKHEQVAAMRLPLLLLLLFITATIKVTDSLNYLKGTQVILYISFWICATIGTIVTSLLMLYEYDTNNSFIKKICSINKKTNCNAVLTSKASRFLGFSWSEIGFFYFGGALFYLLISNSYADNLSPLIILNVLALPYIIFSIYYQGFVVKQWCVLCLIVQTLLMAEFLTAFSLNYINRTIYYGLNDVEYNHILLAFFLPVLVWLMVKPLIYASKEGLELKYNFRRFKNNPDIFNSLQQSQISLKNNPEGLGIMLGNPNAENTLIKVCNPYCGPCAKSFPHLEELLTLNGDKWKVRILFTATPDKDDRRALPVAHFLNIMDKENDNITLKALGDWYNEKNKDYNAYALKHPTPFDFETQKEKLAAMDDWCQKENIRFTPTYYVNGKILAENYSIEDLKNIL
jgi:uncharacterized membrane protein